MHVQPLSEECVWKIDKIMQFQPRRPISQSSGCCLPPSSRWVDLKRATAEMRLMQTWRTKLLQILKWPPLSATQAVKRLVKFTTALLMCSCYSSSRVVYRATFNPWIDVELANNIRDKERTEVTFLTHHVQYTQPHWDHINYWEQKVMPW